MSNPMQKTENRLPRKKYLTLSVGSVEQLESRVLFSALTPAQIEQAYGINKISFSLNGQTITGNGSGQTIAIVDAYADPNIVSDLQVFDKQYGISNTDGKGNFALTVTTPEGQPVADAGWSTEISLDVEWAHAIAPAAHILLVEARTSSLTDLLNAVNYARYQSGVSTVSMSWGSSEFFSERTLDSLFTTPSGHNGVTFVAASGDNGVTSWPATSPNVLAVGGTTLNVSSNGTYQSETAWTGSGGGYSNIEHTYAPDVSYDANPSTGFSVYDSVAYDGMAGWETIGGTSAGAPQWAALIAIADEGRGLKGISSLTGTQTLNAIYTAPSTDFHDITIGHNALYNATTGYDPVTGRGTPVANLLENYLSTYGSTTAAVAAVHGTATVAVAPAFRFERNSVIAADSFFSSPDDAVTGPAKRQFGGRFSRVLI